MGPIIPALGSFHSPIILSMSFLAVATMDATDITVAVCMCDFCVILSGV